MDGAADQRRTVVAVMQPYFAAYAGYYRLLAAADVFVIFDCVQFPRRGWVHRNRLPGASGEAEWLTLPLSAAPYEAPIRDLVFAPDAPARIAERVRAFPSLARPTPGALDLLHTAPFEGPLVDYLEAQIRAAGRLLGLAPRMVRSSSLEIPPDLRAQDRVIEIARKLGATDYVNAPGGRDLYDDAAFDDAGMRLHFLPPYEGSSWSLLERLSGEPAQAVADEIRRQTPGLISSDDSRTRAA